LRSEVRMAQKVGQRLGKREVLLEAVSRLMFERILYIAHDHLNRSCGVLREANPATDAVVLVESERMTTGRPWHKERLFFLISSARHFAAELESQGFTVRYIQAPTTVDGLVAVRSEFGDLPVHCAEPSSYKQYAQLEEFGANFLANDFFLTSRPLFMQWASSQKTYVMENFYRAQRARLGILMVDGKPVGDRWNFDLLGALPRRHRRAGCCSTRL